MQINSIDNSNFGAIFGPPPGYFTNRGVALAELKQMALDAGLSRDTYKRTIRKVHEIFPSDDFSIILDRLGSGDGPFYVGVKCKDGRYLDENIYTEETNPKFLPAKFISTCREIAKRLADK